MSYTDYLDRNGVRRGVIERTEKRPGDLVLRRLDAPVETIEAATGDERKVVAIKRKGRG